MAKNLAKSLADLESLADELLKKSQAADDKGAEDIAPEEISDDAVQGDAEDKKSGEDDLEKCGDNCDGVKKSEETEEVDEAAAEDEDIQKSEETESEEDTEEDEDDEDVDIDEVEKSMTDNFTDNETIAKGMEASEFLTAVVEVLSKSMSDIQYDVMNGAKGQASANDVLAKSLQASLAMNASLRQDNEKLTRRITKLEKSLASGLDRIMDALDDISSQPVGMRKSLASVQVHDRDFGVSTTGAIQKSVGFDSLSKSQVMSALEAELIAGNPAVSASDIIGYESGAPIRQDLQQLVMSKCK